MSRINICQIEKPAPAPTETGKYQSEDKKKCRKYSTFNIGATGFEPATSRPPAVRATKLRHTPMDCIIAKFL